VADKEIPMASATAKTIGLENFFLMVPLLFLRVSYILCFDVIFLALCSQQGNSRLGRRWAEFEGVLHELTS
jgi:hypothetical protein